MKMISCETASQRVKEELGFVSQPVFKGPSRMVRVPLQAQYTEYTCGVACVEALLRFAGFDLKYSEEEYGNALGTTPTGGTKLHRMAEYLNAYSEESIPGIGFSVTEPGPISMEELLESIDEGCPVICLLQSWYSNDDDDSYESNFDYSDEWMCAHYIIALGYNEENLFFMDPWNSEGYTYIPIEDMKARWHFRLKDGTEWYNYGTKIRVVDSGPQQCYFKIL